MYLKLALKMGSLLSFVLFVSKKKIVGFFLSEVDHKKPLSRPHKINFWSQWDLKLVTGMTQNKFIRCFHQFVALIFSMNFSQFEQQLKNIFLLVQNIFFSVYQFKKKSCQIFVKKISNRFGIRNWWNYLMNSL